MTKVSAISIGKKYIDSFNELTICATGNGRSVSSEVCKAIKFYMENFNEAPMLANKDKWDKFIKESSQDEIQEMNRLICEISTRLVLSWKKHR